MIWPHDDRASLVAFYGNPSGGSHGGVSAAWEAKSLTNVVFPWHAVLAWDTHVRCNSARVHIKCADAFEDAFRRIWEACHRDQKQVEAIGAHLYGGAFNFRLKRGLSSLSVHAFGAAIDINPGAFPLGSTKQQPKIITDAFKAVGAVYGGDWRGRKDPMHYQFANT